MREQIVCAAAEGSRSYRTEPCCVCRVGPQRMFPYQWGPVCSLYDLCFCVYATCFLQQPPHSVCRFTMCPSPLSWCRMEVWRDQSPDLRVGCSFNIFVLLNLLYTLLYVVTHQGPLVFVHFLAAGINHLLLATGQIAYNDIQADKDPSLELGLWTFAMSLWLWPK